MYIKTLSYGGLFFLSVACSPRSSEDRTEVHKDFLDRADPTYSIAIDRLKEVYRPGDTLYLTVNGAEERPIDSIRYLMNDKIIGKTVGNTSVVYNFTGTKFGIQVVRAEVYAEGKIEETNVRIDYLPNTAPKLYAYHVVNTYPHDREAYTQGLEFYGDQLLEGTGNGTGPSGKKGESSIRMVDSHTGKIKRIVRLDENIFGEGITVLDKELYQLTYKNNESYVYDVATLAKKKTIPYFKTMEGWGLTNDGKNLLMSDGSENIYILNPNDFKLKDVIQVVTSKGPVDSINELEWVKDKIFANFYREDFIGIIDPSTGVVEGLVDLSTLKTLVTPHMDMDVLNGIAYNKNSNTFFVTGKNWDKIFEIRIDWL